MKIYLISPPWIALPPVGYGGIESVVYNLAEGLVKKGHEVNVFATGDSKLNAKVSFLNEEALGIDILLHKSAVYYMLNQTTSALRQIPEGTQVIHNHCEYSAMHLFEKQKIPFVHTLHGAFYPKFDLDRHKKDFSTQAFIQTLSLFRDHNFVSISNSQRKGMPDLNYSATVYNCIKVEDYPFTAKPQDYMAWIGRFSPLKGLPDAVEAAKKTGRKFNFSTSLHDEKIKQQFDQNILNNLGNNMKNFPELEGLKEKMSFLGNAKVVLFPIKWEEPFGLVMIEAMATGAPVIAYARGSVPEIIKDGETGFLVNPSEDDIRGQWLIKKTGIEGLTEGIEKLYKLPNEDYNKMRENCRRHVEQNFSVDKMVEGYEDVYRKILNSNI